MRLQSLFTGLVTSGQMCTVMFSVSFETVFMNCTQFLTRKIFSQLIGQQFWPFYKTKATVLHQSLSVFVCWLFGF